MLRGLVARVASTVLCAACASCDDPPSDLAPLLEGTYLISDSVLHDDCSYNWTPEDFNGHTVDLDVIEKGGEQGISLTGAWFSEMGLVDEGHLASDGSNLLADFAPDYDCVVAVRVEDFGTIIDRNQFDYLWKQRNARFSGSECAQAYPAPLPCEVVLSMRFTRID